MAILNYSMYGFVTWVVQLSGNTTTYKECFQLAGNSNLFVAAMETVDRLWLVMTFSL